MRTNDIEQKFFKSAPPLTCRLNLFERQQQLMSGEKDGISILYATTVS